MMAAESGYSPAQFNVAYICDQNTVSCISYMYNVDFKIESRSNVFFRSRLVSWIPLMLHAACGDITISQSRVRNQNLMVRHHLYVQSFLGHFL